MSDATSAPAPERDDQRREVASQGIVLLAAIVLGLAAILTAWGSFKASLEGGKVTEAYAAQQALIANANDIYAQSDQASSLEQQFFLTYAINASEGNEGAVGYLETTMPDDLAAVVAWWVDQPVETSPPTPFVADNPEYANLSSQLLLAEGNLAMDDAEAARATAVAAGEVGDRYGLANVFFAIVLFLAGIATLLERRLVQRGLLALSIVILAIGAVILVTTAGWTAVS
ncbi:MAG: hypothetical protein ACYC90_15145 [Candidatus Nanopelagicales bacterium]